MQIGYCGNVHPGRTLTEVKQNLVEYSLAIKQLVRPDQKMGIGLWLSATTAAELDSPDELARFRDWLNEVGLLPFTFNGFPFGDFHRAIVKHDVYLPTWADTSRLDYTIRLAEIQNELLPESVSGTISTLPLGWPVTPGLVLDQSFFRSCASHLQECARRLNRLEQETGRNITVCIEPEPGCLLDTCDDVTAFFANHLLTGNEPQDEMTLKHIGVCHDVCHSAVMFEDQLTAIRAYRDAGIRIGKVQVSSAIKVDFEGKSADEQQQILNQLSAFSEPRYLHQTKVKAEDKFTFYEDLPVALSSIDGNIQGEWRVHFHVPIFSDGLGLIGTTQTEIGSCLNALRELDVSTEHFEIETYAWDVLPDGMQVDSLAIGIAKEILWFQSQTGQSVRRDEN